MWVQRARNPLGLAEVQIQILHLLPFGKLFLGGQRDGQDSFGLGWASTLLFGKWFRCSILLAIVVPQALDEQWPWPGGMGSILYYAMREGCFLRSD